MPLTLEASQIVKQPLVTEKSTWETESRNRYAFEVVMNARKPQIKDAIESLYGVRVERVSTQVRKGKYRRTRFGTAKTADWKKAVVELHPDDRIELF
ncbi:MAG: 50S ribosomal protein L23 [Planctomycetota bacterium]